MAAVTGADLWQFSLAFYARPGIAPACLVLQDRHELDVNLALYCCWLGLSGRGRIGAAELAAADAAIARWRGDVIGPLRAIRRSLKPEAAAHPESASLREQVKAVELEAERICQSRLAALAPAPSVQVDTRCRDDARVNLETYLGPACGDGAPLFEALRTYVDPITAGTLPD